MKTPKKKPFIIPIFLPHAGCRHRCVFCDQSALTGQSTLLPAAHSLREQVENFLRFKGKQREGVQIAFYGGNFLGLAQEKRAALLEEAAALIQAARADSIRFSTRPDTITADSLAWLKNFPIAVIELGVQSMDDRVLARSMRGHTALDTEKAVALLKETTYELGLQLMVGLPGDDENRSICTAERIAVLHPDFVRIYPTVVLRDSPLARLYQDGKYSPLSLEAAVSLTRKMYLVFEAAAIPVIRMGVQASKDLAQGVAIVAGPFHPAFGQLVYAEILLDKARSLLEKSETSGTATLEVHPRSLSRLQGIRNRNIHILKKEFNLQSIGILPDETVPENELRLSQ